MNEESDVRLRLFLAAPLALGALILGACSDSNDDPATPATQAQATTAATGAATTAATAAATAAGQATPAGQATAAASATPTSQAVTKVSANNATRAELQAAFTAAGITGAAQWAREVEEYRPYPTSDPNMAKLRQELAKYNPGPGVVDKIVATLSLP